ncbi:hypothetical protein KKH13_05055 [Patescibacteria group bacterium]|nr:hypothetical protein [Patescibacteria group bacterium]
MIINILAEKILMVAEDLKNRHEYQLHESNPRYELSFFFEEAIDRVFEGK